jgi:hypothetical protein
LEWSKVNLSKSSLGNDRVFSHSLVLLVVTDKVLNGSTDALPLKSVDVRCSDQTGKSGVFRKGFESSTSEGRSLDIDRRSQETDCVSGFSLVGK